jgi:photosystem II stability/assembly factor-like uncharacterized protein
VCVDKDSNGNGVCAVADSSCASGFRYDRSAGKEETCYSAPAVLDMSGIETDMTVVDFDVTASDLARTSDLVTVSADLSSPPDLTVVRRWVTRSPPGGHTVVGTAANDLYLAGPTIYRSTDFGATWPAGTITPSPTGLGGMWFGSASNGYIANAATNGTVAYQTTGGNSWSSVAGPINVVIQKVWGTSDGNAVFAVGLKLSGGGVILKRTNNNGSFVDIGASAGQRAVAVYGTPTGDLILVATNSAAGGSLLKATSTAGVFASTYSNSAELYAVWCTTNGSDIYVVGGGGLIVHSTDAGVSWTPETGAPNADLFAVWGASGTDVWAVGNNGVIVRRQANGTWAPIASPTSVQLLSIWGSSAADIWAAGSNVLIHYE